MMEFLSGYSETNLLAHSLRAMAENTYEQGTVGVL